MTQELRHIVRLAGTEVAGSRPVKIGLNKIKGVSFRMSDAVIKVLKLDPKQKMGLLKEQEIKKIEECLSDPIKHGIPGWMTNRKNDPVSGQDEHVVGHEMDLRLKNDLDLLKKTKSCRGMRHAHGLKVRGQRTKSTGRRGKTVGVHRKKGKQGGKK